MSKQKSLKKTALGARAGSEADSLKASVDDNRLVTGESIQDISINLLIGGNVNSFIEFFKLSHSVPQRATAAKPLETGAARVKQETEHNRIQDIISQLTISEKLPTTDASVSIDTVTEEQQATSVAVEATPTTSASEADHAATLAAEAIVDQDAGETFEHPRSEIEKKAESSRIAGTTSKIERVLCAKTFTANKVLPSDPAEQRALLDSLDDVMQQRILPLSTLKALVSHFTQLEACNRRADHEAAFECLTKLGTGFLELQQYASAIRYFADGLETAKLTHSILREYNARVNLAGALVKAKLLALGLEQYERAHKLSVAFQNRLLENEAAVHITETTLKYCAELTQTETLVKSLALLTDALAVLKNVNYEGVLLQEVEYALGKTFYEIGNYESAIEHLSTYLQYCAKYNDISKRGLAQVTLAACYEKCDKPELSAKVLQDAMGVAAKDSGNGDEAAEPSNLPTQEVASRLYRDAVLALYANADAFVQLGSIKFRQQAYDSALTSLEHAYKAIDVLETERATLETAVAENVLPFVSTLQSSQIISAATKEELLRFGAVWKTLGKFNLSSIACQLAIARTMQHAKKLAYLIGGTRPIQCPDSEIYAADKADREALELTISGLQQNAQRNPELSAGNSVRRAVELHMQSEITLQRSCWSQLLALKSHETSLSDFSAAT